MAPYLKTPPGNLYESYKSFTRSCGQVLVKGKISVQIFLSTLWSRLFEVEDVKDEGLLRVETGKK